MNTDILKSQMQDFTKPFAFAPDFVMPDYETFNVRNILPQVWGLFSGKEIGSHDFRNGYLDEHEGVEKVVLVIFDGLGYNRLLSHLTGHEGFFENLVENGVLNPLTTVFPSTTSSVLTSIFTGLAPSQHLILGYHMFSKKYGLVYDTLDMKPVYGYNGQVELARDYSRNLKPLLPYFEQNGIKTLVATKASIAESGLSQITHPDQKLIPYLLSSDMLVRSKQALERQGRTLLVVYYSGVDTLAHRYGPYSEEVTFELRSIERNLKAFAGELSEQTRKKTLLVLTADHGVAETRKTYFTKDYPELDNMLRLPPVGDSRACFLFVRPNLIDSFPGVFEKTIRGFELFSSMDLIEKGAFGPLSDVADLKEKVGDFCAIANGPTGLAYPFYEEDRGRLLLGTHGGMTAEEMVVPFLSVRLSKIQQ